MTRALIAGKSGWGKSWLTQAWTEDNLGNYEAVLLLDYKDEYRGLAKAGLSKWVAVGRQEAALGVDAWRELIQTNGRLVAARSVDLAEWREACERMILAARDLPVPVLVVVDEAHFVAPEGGGYPDGIEGLATTGRGEQTSSAWVTQRLQNLDETVISQCDTRLLGGFESDRDLTKLEGVVGYGADVHDITAADPGGRWDDPVTKHPASDGDGLAGSEWIYSDDSGDVRRVDSRDMSMQSTHYGGSDVSMTPPGE